MPRQNLCSRSDRRAAPRWTLVAAAALLPCVAGARVVLGQAAPTTATPVVTPTPLPPVVPPITNATRNAAALLTPAQNAEISNFVSKHVTNLAATGPTGEPVNPTAVTIAVQALAAGAQGGSSYFNAGYAQAVSSSVVRALQTTDVRTRISVGVAVARIATAAPHSQLSGAILALLGDKSPAVGALGVKAAIPVYPLLLGGVQRDADAVARQVIGLLRLHGKSSDDLSEPLAVDAFEALAGDAVIGPASPAMRQKSGIDSVLLLLHARVELWGEQNAIPGDAKTCPPLPNLESKPVLFLSSRTGWVQLTAAQKASAGRVMWELAKETNRLAPLMPAAPAGPVQPGVWQKDLYDLQRQTIAGIEVAANANAALEVVLEARNCGTYVGVPANAVVLGAGLETLQKKMSVVGMFGNSPALPTLIVNEPATPKAPATKTSPVPSTPAPKIPGSAALNK